MDTLSYKTISANSATAKKEWVVIDAKDQVLGRLSSVAAIILRGKNKTEFTPHADTGDNVIVINAEKVKLTGNKWEDKQYVRHTGYPGGQRIRNAAEMRDKFPIRIIENAVRGMLPKSRLGNKLYKNLYIYVGAEHPHEAQNPKEININSIK